VGVDLGRFKRALAGTRRIGLDTQVLIYHLEDIAPYTELTTYVLTEASVGTLELLMSVVSLSEILVKPWQEGDGDRTGQIRTALESLPGIRFADITVAVAAEGAALRGRTGLPLPDALIVASVVNHGAQAVMTNDKTWRAKKLPCRTLILDEYS
jgi:predicted nucleic acid-binding protein